MIWARINESALWVSSDHLDIVLGILRTKGPVQGVDATGRAVVDGHGLGVYALFMESSIYR